MRPENKIDLEFARVTFSEKQKLMVVESKDGPYHGFIISESDFIKFVNFGIKHFQEKQRDEKEAEAIIRKVSIDNVMRGIPFL